MRNRFDEAGKGVYVAVPLVAELRHGGGSLFFSGLSIRHRSALRLFRFPFPHAASELRPQNQRSFRVFLIHVS
jgi:hypothetical protein